MSIVFVFVKQKTAYEMRISDLSSDVCSSDLRRQARQGADDGAGGDSQQRKREILEGKRRKKMIEQVHGGKARRSDGNRADPAKASAHAERGRPDRKSVE